MEIVKKGPSDMFLEGKDTDNKVWLDRGLDKRYGSA